MKLEIERTRYRAGHPTRVRTVVWDVSSHRIDGEDAVPLTPDQLADLIMDGQLLYHQEGSIIRLKVLRTFGV